MTNNVTANPGADGPVFKTDEVDGVHTPVSKIAFGVDGSVTTVDELNPLPVMVTSAVISGEVALDSATLAALETVQIGNFPSTQTVAGNVSVSNFPVSQPVTGAFYPATQPVSGSVSVSNFPESQPVTGTFWQTTQPVSGPLTDAQLRATPVPISGTIATGGLTDMQLRASAVPVSGTISTGLSQPLTDTQLRANPVPVSGTVTANTGLTQPLTDLQLRASDVNVSLDGEELSISNFPSVQTVDGSGVTQPISATSLPLPNGAAQDATVVALNNLTDTTLYALDAILEKMPRVTGLDQAAVSLEGGTVTTVTTVTTCGTVTTISQIGTRAAMTAADAMINMGANHLYRQIVVS